MPVFQVTKGLDIPIAGEPDQTVHDARTVDTVAVLARDYVGSKLRLVVEPGERVRAGQAVMTHRSYPELRLVAPVSGTVAAVHRGDKRALQSVVVARNGDEPHTLAAFSPNAGRNRDGARALLFESGLWAVLRTRPFSRMPEPDSAPHSIFVTALDTQPLAPNVDVVLHGRDDDFERGLDVLTQLTDGPVFLCCRAGSPLAAPRRTNTKIRVAEFTGKHPAGTVGYHIHVLDPVHRGKTVWHIGAQDVARVGHLFATGMLDASHVVALGGPCVTTPRLLRTVLGASLAELLHGEVADGPSRTISGSVLTGDRAEGEALGYIGRFHQQVSVIAEGTTREFLGWMAPGARTFSALPAFVSSLLPKRRFALDTAMHGSRRAMVPIGAYERVMPMDLMPTHLLRALTVGDVEWAEELGVLELDEEDVALCTFVCPGKYEYGPALRRTLATLAAES